MKRIFLWMLTLVMVAGLLCGCGAKSESANLSADSAAGGLAEIGSRPAAGLAEKESLSNSLPISSTGSTQTVATPANQKLVRKIRIEAETEDLNTLLTQVDAHIGKLGGYCENRETYHGNEGNKYRYRQATLTIRIPEENLDPFISQISGIFNIISSNETAEDITLTYIATESRVKALQTEHDRLLELLAKAETVSDLLEIESRLTSVRAELERYASQLKLYDNMVSYGTITLQINEVKEYTVTEEPETFWERISSGFMGSLKGVGIFFRELVIWLIAALPYLVLIGAAVAILIILIKRRKKNKNK